MAKPASRPVKVWAHPHIIGSAVIEDQRGQLWLVFLNRKDAWARRVQWAQGINELLPHGEPENVLQQIGFPE